MYARVTPGRTDVATADQVRRLTEETLMPAFRQMPGLRDYLALYDETTGHVMSITIWETREQATAPPPQLADVRAKYEEAGVDFSAPVTYEIVARS